MSNIEIGLISLFGKLKEDKIYIYFGLFEADYLAISKSSAEIIILDHEDEGFILFRCASNSERFLDALNLVWSTISLFLTNEEKADDIEYRKKTSERCTELAGGIAYEGFYKTILGI